MIKWIDKKNKNPYKLQTYIFMKIMTKWVHQLTTNTHPESFIVAADRLEQVMDCYKNNFTNQFKKISEVYRKSMSYSERFHVLINLGQITKDKTFTRYCNVLYHVLMGEYEDFAILKSIVLIWTQHNVRIYH